MLLEQPDPHRRRDSRGTITDAEFFVQPLHVGLYRGRRQVQFRSDRGDAATLGDEIQHVTLARGEHRCLGFAAAVAAAMRCGLLE